MTAAPFVKNVEAGPVVGTVVASAPFVKYSAVAWSSCSGVTTTPLDALSKYSSHKFLCWIAACAATLAAAGPGSTPEVAGSGPGVVIASVGTGLAGDGMAGATAVAAVGVGRELGIAGVGTVGTGLAGAGVPATGLATVGGGTGGGIAGGTVTGGGPP
jgi:hypothetical protein